jgi:hypothetical protein
MRLSYLFTAWWHFFAILDLRVSVYTGINNIMNIGTHEHEKETGS